MNSPDDVAMAKAAASVSAALAFWAGVAGWAWGPHWFVYAWGACFVVVAFFRLGRISV